MPIFEYTCDECGTTFERLTIRPQSVVQTPCPQCGSMQTTKVFGRDMTKVGVLFMNATHDNEMYGQMVAYMRIKGVVPPSSESRP